MSSNGERGMLKKVALRPSYGERVFDQHVLGMDYLDCSKKLVKDRHQFERFLRKKFKFTWQSLVTHYICS